MAANSESFSFPSLSGKADVTARAWLPEGPPKAMVQLLHGLNQSMEDYESLGRFLADRGYLTYGQDILGHGKTVGEKGIPGFFAPEKGDDYVLADILTLQKDMMKAYPNLRAFMIGHSMGSFFLRRILIEYPELCQGAVLMGNGHMSRSEYRFARVLGKFLAFTHKEAYRPGIIGRFGIRVLNHTLWIPQDAPDHPTIELYLDLVHTLGLLRKEENVLKMNPDCPILILYGGLDPLGKFGKVGPYLASLFQQGGSQYVSLKAYPKARHELLTDPEAPGVMDDILLWLDALCKMEDL